MTFCCRLRLPSHYPPKKKNKPKSHFFIFPLLTWQQNQFERRFCTELWSVVQIITVRGGESIGYAVGRAPIRGAREAEEEGEEEGCLSPRGKGNSRSSLKHQHFVEGPRKLPPLPESCRAGSVWGTQLGNSFVRPGWSQDTGILLGRAAPTRAPLPRDPGTGEGRQRRCRVPRSPPCA